MNERFQSLAPSRAPGANGGFRQRCVSSMKHSVTIAVLAKPSAVVLTALAAIVMTGYLKRKTAYPDPETLCSNCQHPNSLLAWHCYNCGSSIEDNLET